MLEKPKTRALRRHHEKRIQYKRYLYYRYFGFGPLTEYPERYGYLKHGHWSCGCGMCKPWKATKASKEPKHSDRKRKLESED